MRLTADLMFMIRPAAHGTSRRGTVNRDSEIHGFLWCGKPSSNVTRRFCIQFQNVYDALRCVQCGQPWSGNSRFFHGAVNRLLEVSRCDAFSKTVRHFGETLKENRKCAVLIFGHVVAAEALRL